MGSVPFIESAGWFGELIVVAHAGERETLALGRHGEVLRGV